MSDYLVICDRSGFRCKRSECRKEWNGKIVRKDFWEPRHPQDTIKSKADKTSVPDARTQRPDPPLLAANITADDLI